MIRSLFFLLLFSGILIVFSLSWSPQPDLTKYNFIPLWLGQWANEYDKFRTGVPFFFLGITASIWLSYKKYSWKAWLLTWMGFILITIIAEIGQIFLPARVFDWVDILWGIAGSFLGMAPIAIFNLLTKKKNLLKK